MRIGEVSRKTGASPKALRLYEQLGLLPTPLREGSYRSYDSEHVDAVLLIRQAQAAGFKLQELSEMLRRSGFAPGLEALLQAVRKKRAELGAEIQALQARDAHLAHCEAQLQDARLAALNCAEWSVKPAD